MSGVAGRTRSCASRSADVREFATGRAGYLRARRRWRMNRRREPCSLICRVLRVHDSGKARRWLLESGRRVGQAIAEWLGDLHLARRPKDGRQWRKSPIISVVVILIRLRGRDTVVRVAVEEGQRRESRHDSREGRKALESFRTSECQSARA